MDLPRLRSHEIGPRSSPSEAAIRTVARVSDLGDVANTRDLGGSYNLNVLLEIAWVPLYWIAEAGFTPSPVESVRSIAPRLPVARWLVKQGSEVTF
jgi:hypothetical protein